MPGLRTLGRVIRRAVAVELALVITFLPAATRAAGPRTDGGLWIDPKPGTTVSGRLLLPTGRPAVGVQVILDLRSADPRDAAAGWLSAETDETGRFEIDDVARATYALEVLA